MEAVEADDQAQAHLSVHQRTWATLLKCGAKTRSGRPCLGLIVRGKRRCRMHGGAKGSGGQLGNTNRLKHGRYTRDAVETRTLTRLFGAVNDLIDATMAVVGIVARGDHEGFARAVQFAEQRAEQLQGASAKMERFLVETGRADEARELAAEMTQLTNMLPGERQAATTSGSPTT
ncbi:MAG: HGGxSTG domain-containing protein [Mycobacterium sp.]